MGICSFSAPQPIGVSFRFRKCKFSNNSRNAIQHSAVDIWSGLPAPARDIHRARSPRLHALSVASSRGEEGLLTGLWHGDPAYKYLRGILAWRRGSSDRSSARPSCPQVPQWHPHVPNNPAISLKPASNRPSTGLRHGDPSHRYLSAIPAWRRWSSISARP